MWSLLIVLVIAVTGVLTRWSERRREAREAYLRECVKRNRAEVDHRIDRHFATLPDFVNGEPS